MSTAIVAREIDPAEYMEKLKHGIMQPVDGHNRLEAATRLLQADDEILHETMQVSPQVAKLFLSLLRPEPNTQVYCNRLDHCLPVAYELAKARLKVSGIGTSVLTRKAEQLINTTWEESHKRDFIRLETDDPEFYKPEEKFHYAFGVYPFKASLDPELIKRPTSPLYRGDRLSQWQCSKLTIADKADPARQTTGNARRAAGHMMGLEGLLSSCLVGGYFAAVLPKRWVGREQSYLRWWQNRAAIVARIELPRHWVRVKARVGDHGKWGSIYERDMPGEWELVIWQRSAMYDASTPNSALHVHAMKWVELRHPQFIVKLSDIRPDFPEENVNDRIVELVQMFQASDWWRLSVAALNDYIENHSNNQHYGINSYQPHKLPNVDDTWILEPSERHQYHIRVLPGIEHIAGRKSPDKKRWLIRPMQKAAHITVTNKIRLRAYGEQGLVSAGQLLDMRNEAGISLVDGEKVFALDKALRRRNYADFKEELLENLEKHGLVPAMSQNDFDRVIKAERHLSLQLTPVERLIPIQKGKTSDDLSSDERAWELIYEDIGMEATWPELMAMWRQRAKKIGLDRVGTTFEFQYSDIVVIAAKTRIANCNVMGLGKTRETLFAFLLRGGRKLLIICPSKLIGVWQDEIRDTLAPYMNRQKRNWNGELFRCSLNIIQKADDLRRSNLKTFNIISYDTLKTIPNDSQFYKCPRCGIVVCKKMRSDYVPTCPGNPAQPEQQRCDGAVKRWREDCKKQGLKKHHFLVDSEGGVLFEINPKAVARRKFPQENIKVVDPRPTKPDMRMEEVPNMHKKMKCIPDGWEKVKDVNGVETGESRQLFKWIERKVGPVPIHVKWTFSNLIRRLFNHAAADEAQYASNEDAQRTIALLHTRTIKHKYPLTGTPVKGYPKKVIPVINWAFPRSMFPDYQLYDDDGESNFLRKFQTEVRVDRTVVEDEEDDGTDEGKERSRKKSEQEAIDNKKLVKRRKPANGMAGEKKIVPKINNPELFQAELAPVMVRHLRTEPIVVRDIPRKIVVSLDHAIPMDEDHKEYYQQWLEVFAEWYRIKKEEEDKETVGEGPLIAKLQYLYAAATMPHFMLDGIEKSKDETVKKWAKLIDRYDNFLRKKAAKEKRKLVLQPTAKFRELQRLLLNATRQGDKSLVFCTRHANLQLGQNWCEQAKIGSVRVDGSVSLKIKDGESRSARHALVDQFRFDPRYSIAWCGLEAMAEGMNVPEANHGFVNDFTWEPTAIRQGIGRMIRPAQTKTIFAHYMYHKGTIEEYMAALCYLKNRSGDEGVDYMPFSDFSGTLVPDIHQYAKAVVDGTEKVVAAKMWASIDYLKKHGSDEDEGGLYAGG